MSAGRAAAGTLDPVAELRRLEREIARLRNALRADVAETIELPESAFSVLLVEVSGQRYGVALESVVEVVQIARLVRHGPDASSVLGVLNFRGAAVPVLDLGRRLVGDATRTRLSTPIVIVQTAGRRIGLVCDRVRTMATVPNARDRRSSASDRADASIIAVVDIGGDLVQLIDPDVLYDAEVRATLEGDAREPGGDES